MLCTNFGIKSGHIPLPFIFAEQILFKPCLINFIPNSQAPELCERLGISLECSIPNLLHVKAKKIENSAPKSLFIFAGDGIMPKNTFKA